jgi:hypothetical protein
VRTVFPWFFFLRNSPFSSRLLFNKQTREDGEIPSRARRCDQGRKPGVNHCLKRWEGVASRLIGESEDLSGVNSGQSFVVRGVSNNTEDKYGVPEQIYLHVRGFSR